VRALWIARVDSGQVKRTWKVLDGTPRAIIRSHLKGCLRRFDPDGTVTEFLSGIYYSSGVGWSPDNKYMYYNNTVGRITRRFDFDPEAGTISNGVDFTDFREPDDLPSPRTTKELLERLLGGEPRGLVTDTEGNIWIALWDKGRVLCFKPDGELIREAKANDPPYLACPTWAGEDMDILFCTSARGWGRGGANGGKLWRLDVGKQWVSVVGRNTSLLDDHKGNCGCINPAPVVVYFLKEVLPRNQGRIRFLPPDRKLKWGSAR